MNAIRAFIAARPMMFGAVLGGLLVAFLVTWLS